MRNLVLTGGIRHAFEDNTRIVVDLLARDGIESEITEDIAAGIRRLDAERFDLVTVMALRWPMQGDPKYAPYRQQHGFLMPQDCRDTLRRFVTNGGGLLGLHTACLCFDDWRGWRDLLGGAWAWGRSFHPPPGPASVRPTETRHVLTAGLDPFEVFDEIYSGLDIAPGIAPLLTATAASGPAEPVLWAHCPGEGRVVFDALGHDRRSLLDATHGRLIRRSAAWAGGAAEEAVERS